MTTDRLSNVIRRKFVDYFTKKHGHIFVPSSPVKPSNDKTLSFVNAGMNQFKGLFLKDLPKYGIPRACNYQKCIRVGGKLCDLDVIGHDHRHHTFFEMLGNWSFNDYGRANACEWALDFLVNELKLDINKIKVTYHADINEQDSETREIWSKLGIDSTQIVANNKGDNFWTMGQTGPCGPSTEIFYPTVGGELLEIWNLVFIDRLKTEDCEKTVPLKGRFVDTGMGLERLLCILEGVESNYKTDLFNPLMKAIALKAPNVKPYGGSLGDDLDINYRKLADHCRMITVALADGIVTGRRGNMFDLRSIIKKCILISKEKFEQTHPRLLLFDLVDQTVDTLSEAYPELKNSVSNTRRVLAFESKRYLRHLEEQNTASKRHLAENGDDDTKCDNKKPRKLRNIKQTLRMAEQSSLPSPSDVFTIAGRIVKFRPYKNFNFVDVSDGSCGEHIQVIMNKSILVKPELGAYLVCDGNIDSSRGHKQFVEFKAKNLVYYGDCDPNEYPLASKFEPSNIWFRRNLHLRPHSTRFASLLRVRSEVEMSLHMIMKQMDFFRVHTPSITSNDSEASSDLFTIQRTKLAASESHDTSSNFSDATTEDSDSDNDENRTHPNDPIDSQSVQSCGRLVSDDYFGKDVYLASSAQLHLECLAASLSRVYTISSAFRAENSISTRHLCEFIMFEAEEANTTDLGALMDRVETIIKFVSHYCGQVSEYSSDLKRLIDKAESNHPDIYDKLCEHEYVRMTYDEALDILANKVCGFELPTSYGCDISRRHENRLLEYCGQVPIFVTDYPRKLKPFYMKTRSHPNRQNEVLANCFDLIAPVGGEICGGSLREDDYAKLVKHLEDKDVTNNFSWYLANRKFGSFPHGGFGIGIDRLLQSILGIRNIKDTIAFPRWVGHCHT